MRRGALVAGAAVVVGAIAIVVSGGGDCGGAALRSGATAEVHVGARPRIGGGGLGQLRRAFGDQQVAYCDDFADPFVLVVDDVHYAYSTSSGGMHVPVLTAGNVFRAGSRHEALPKLPSWAVQNATLVWAPSVLARGDRYVLYYTVGAPDGRHCISVATSDDPAGPFVDRSSGPFVCADPRGAIDPSPFVNGDGHVFLQWKNIDEGVIVSSELTADGLGLVGRPQRLIGADQVWEASVVEGPSMVAAGGRYYLFYSGNDWRTANYAVGYAVCETPLGPCAKPASGPWLASSDGAQGPGGPQVFRDRDGLWMVVHAWVGGRVGYPDGARNLFVLRVAFTAAGPVAA
jgi:Glycosyl hydrolases family 43